MIRYLSLLRGINFTGHNRILMEDLRRLYEDLGFSSVKSYSQSGNVLFNTSETDTAFLKQRIEEGIQQTFGFAVEVFLFTPEEWKKIMEENPYRQEAAGPVVLTFLLHPPHSLSEEEIQKALAPEESCKVTDRVVYLHLPVSYGQSNLRKVFSKKKLGTPVTSRNWPVVQKLGEMLAN